MSAFSPLFKAERIKWRRSWTLVVALLAPLFQLFFLFEIFWFSEVQVNRIGPGFLVWYQINHAAWNTIFMPITVAMIAAISWELEEDCRAWNHVLLQPVDRRFHYLTKFLSHLSLVVLSQVVFAVLLLLGGMALRAMVPKLLMGSPRPVVWFQAAVASMAAILPIVGLHTWVSYRIPGLMCGLVLALGGSWLTVYLVGKTSVGGLSPWAMAIQSAGVVQQGGLFPWSHFLAGTAWATAFVILGCADFSSRKKQH